MSRLTHSEAEVVNINHGSFLSPVLLVLRGCPSLSIPVMRAQLTRLDYGQKSRADANVVGEASFKLDSKPKIDAPIASSRYRRTYCNRGSLQFLC
jgi:hypothetical protein